MDKATMDTPHACYISHSQGPSIVHLRMSWASFAVAASTSARSATTAKEGAASAAPAACSIIADMATVAAAMPSWLSMGGAALSRDLSSTASLSDEGNGEVVFVDSVWLDDADRTNRTRLALQPHVTEDKGGLNALRFESML